MIIAKHIITVFNKYNADTPPYSEAWARTVIKFAQWEDSTNRNFTSTGATFIDKYISIIIPKNANTEGKKYIPPKEWGLLPAAQKLLTWTLEQGSDIFLGEVPPLAGGYTYTQARKDFVYCLIKSVEDLTNQPILPHWEVTGI